MTFYQLPEKIEAVLFDIDGTLYTSKEYVAEQVDVQVRHYAHIHNMTEEEARNMIQAYRKKWASEHDGKKISLGNAFTAFGVDIQTSIKWRNSLLEPEKYLFPNTDLIHALSELQKKMKLICVTNNPVQAARRTLKAVGLDSILPNIVGLDTCYKSKPSKEIIDTALSLANTSYEKSIAVGDRYDIDLALPLSLGMGAVLVSGAEEVTKLAQKLIEEF